MLPGIRVIDAGDYAVHIGRGLRHELASRVMRVAPAHRYAIVTDERVAPLYANNLVEGLGTCGRATLHVIPAGEAHKTRATWAHLTDAMLDAGCARDTTVVALGGGVVGDLAGFVAATYMRGVPVVQCPTTLLAMIDASLGGKTGVDTAAGKNLVGAFHHPAAVFADVEMLATLPGEHLRAGLAEAIKHGVIADASYFASLDASLEAILAGDSERTLNAVSRSVEIKLDVVRADVLEHGRRKILNFGHTIGHAIEMASGFSLLHGECVAIGMVLEARLAERLGVAGHGTAGAIEHILGRAQLPTACPAGLGADTVLTATRLDKKSRAGSVEYALPSRIGAMADEGNTWSVRVDDALVREVLG